MKYKITDIFLTNADCTEKTTEFEVETLSAKKAGTYPEVVKGVDLTTDEGLDSLIKVIFENSNLKELGFAQEDLLNLPEPILTKIYFDYVYGAVQEVVCNKAENNLFDLKFYDLNGVEYKTQATQVSALVSRKYKEFLKNGTIKKPNEKQSGNFILGICKVLGEVVSLEKETDYLEKFSPYTISTIYQNLSLTEYNAEKKA